MVNMRNVERGMSRLMLAALAVLIAVVIWTANPWERRAVAVRPDTGVAAATLEPEAIAPVLTTLLTRVYGAFGQIEEAAIYDGLATAVASDLLTDLYLQRRAVQARGPETPEDPEAGIATIVDLSLDDWTLIGRSAQGYELDATWTVVGIVGHTDHQHERVNAYTARLTLGPADDAWRLTAFDLDQVRRQQVPLFFDAFE